MTCWLARVGQLVFYIDLQPSVGTAFLADAANDVVAAPFPPRIPQRFLDCLRVIRMDVTLQKLLSRQIAIPAGVSKDLERAVIGPNHTICLDIPVKDTKSSRVRRDAQTCLALAERSLCFIQVRNINDRTDRAHGAQSVGGIAVVPPPLDRHPPDSSVGPHDPMHTAPFSSIGRGASR